MSPRVSLSSAHDSPPRVAGAFPSTWPLARTGDRGYHLREPGPRGGGFPSRGFADRPMPGPSVVPVTVPRRLPVVLTREEVRAVLGQLNGVPRLMVLLLYGAGLRVLECARLRVKDTDFASNQIVIRAGKGAKDRVTMLPAAVKG